jgi:prepilin peptidase CpaA
MLIALVGLLSLICIINDISYRKISNELCALIFALCSYLSIASGQIAALYSFLIMFFVTCVLFIKGVIAAGDSKLICAYSIAIPLTSLPFAIYNMCITGGVLAIFYFIKYRLFKKVKKGQDPGIPYGAAISLGFYIPILALYL